MLTALDVKSKIHTYLDSNLDTMLTTINAERSTSVPLSGEIDPENWSGIYPTVFVELGDSVFDVSEGQEWLVLRETFNLLILIACRDDTIAGLKTQCEVYSEAILRLLAGYEYNGWDGNYYMLAVTTNRSQIDTENGSFTKDVGITFEVHRNKH